ncbi:MAG: type II restriction endonuclease [Calditrichia bacterium]
MNTIDEIDLVDIAIDAFKYGEKAFCKFISANDAGKTGGHQAGFYIPKDAFQLAFDAPGLKGGNKEKFVKILWQHSFNTESRFVYYGKKTRNEYRLTRFGKGFPFFADEYVGALLVIIQNSNTNYRAFVFSKEESIETIYSSLNLSVTDNNVLVPLKGKAGYEDKLNECFLSYIDGLQVDFPPTLDLAQKARECYRQVHRISDAQVRGDSDKYILGWLKSEYRLFKTIENQRYEHLVKKPLGSVDILVKVSNSILNRRKSRAGKSLEHHLAAMFKINSLRFEAQAVTEGKKNPDFLFPNAEAYHNPNFNKSKLVFLASKTTCKDRWRQILNEADKLQTKYLFTLQQGISRYQLREMYSSGVRLVVPRAYLKSYPKEYHNDLSTLGSFISKVKALQS